MGKVSNAVAVRAIAAPVRSWGREKRWAQVRAAVIEIAKKNM